MVYLYARKVTERFLLLITMPKLVARPVKFLHVPNAKLTTEKYSWLWVKGPFMEMLATAKMDVGHPKETHFTLL